LDYLEHLGVNAIELMPVQEFDGNDSWGYNPSFFFAMDKAYGTKEMYKNFIDECHRRGIAVILDVVYNHATGQHPFAKLYWNSNTNQTAANNPWFNVTAPHPYSVFHDFNHESPLVRAFVKRNLDFLLTEYKFDGFRFDLTKGFTQNSSNESTASRYDASRIAILRDYYSQVKASNPNAYMIIEHFCDDNEERELAEIGMIPWGNKNHEYCEAGMGYQPSSSFLGFNGWTKGWTYNNLVSYMESHDEERVMHKTKTWGANDAIKTDIGTQMQRMALNAAFFLPVPGAKMIWQFGELGYDISIDQGGRTSRKPIRWDYFDVPERRELYVTYSKLNYLRTQYESAFDNPSLWAVNVNTNDWNSGRRIALNSDELKMVIIGNFKPDGSAITNPNFPVAGVWHDYMTGETLNVTNTNMTIELAPGQFKVFTNERIEFNLELPILPNGIVDIETSKLTIYQSGGYLNIATEQPIISAKIYNVNGMLVKNTQGENSISVADLPKSCYILRVQLNGQNTAFKFIK